MAGAEAAGAVTRPAADALARANLLHQASTAGLKALDDLSEDDPYDVDEQLRDRVRRRDFAAWEALGGNDESPSSVYARRRLLMIDAERAKVLEVRSTGAVAHEVVSQVLTMLDVEETTLSYSEAERERIGTAAPTMLEGDCEHLRQVVPCVDPQTPGQCAGCLEEGTQPVRLRMCVTCGYVGCCDSSPGLHATRHFQATGHPVMRSIEPGDDWRWCYVDELLG